MTSTNGTNQKKGRTKRGLLALSGFLDKKHAEQDLEELKLLEAKRCALLSESSLKKEWLRAEEDEAWKEL